MTRLVAANWKMNGSAASARRLAEEVVSGAARLTPPSCEIVLCPPFPHLAIVADALRGSAIAIGGQDVHWESAGAFTGEVSAPMLRDLGCSYVIIGHSERRTHLGETDERVARKLGAAVGAGLVPILCVGESEAERAAGGTDEVLQTQLARGLDGVSFPAGARLEIAYEPVWAIGTGRTATPATAREAHAWIRETCAGLLPLSVSAGLRILYGGSVNAANAGELLASEGIDGALVGGASLDAHAFLAIAGAVGRFGQGGGAR